MGDVLLFVGGGVFVLNIVSLFTERQLVFIVKYREVSKPRGKG